MEKASPDKGGSSLAGASGRLAQRLFVIFENRLQLVLVEVEEERERVLRAVWLAMAVGVFGLLAGVTATLLLVVACWNYSPVLALAVLTLVYLSALGFFLVQLTRLQRDWQTLPATLEQLRKDRECLKKHLD
jgi:uncharacterized membrane protein YqjE